MNNPSDPSKLTPMMKQFFGLKKKVPDSILFFRMGDFYEIFGDDATLVAPKLSLTLTSRERGDQQKIPFCGAPHHSAKTYITKLLKMGHRVAIADQTEDPATAKGLVKRDIVQVLSPGCIEDIDDLIPDEPNYLLSLYECPETKSLAVMVVDISTGECRLGNTSERIKLADYLKIFSPKEILVRRFAEESLRQEESEYFQSHNPLVAHLPEHILRDSGSASSRVSQNLGHADFKKLACGEIRGGCELLAATLTYLDSMHATTAQIINVEPLISARRMTLDETAIRDLEIFLSLRRGEAAGSLYKEMNTTVTAAGARLLRSSLAAPFTEKTDIVQRQQDCQKMLEQGVDFLSELRTHLRDFHDIQRLATKLVNGKILPTELVKVRKSLEKAQLLTKLIADIDFSEELTGLSKVCSELDDTLTLLKLWLNDEPGVVGSLEVLRPGSSAEFDKRRDLAVNGHSLVQDYEHNLREETGIGSLKIKKHKTFGLLIEVTKSNLDRVPAYFIRRQTMVNNERFVTDELSELDGKLEEAEAEARKAEHSLYLRLVEKVSDSHERLTLLSQRVASVDLIQAFAYLARERRLVRPKTIAGKTAQNLELKACRHLVVESFVGRHDFMPNDVHFSKDRRHLLITGPNMAGKSTTMRQVALSAIMHQIGCFVPCESATMPVFDRIFTRVGAADDLSKGQSTFMVEMSEAAGILRQASARSLVILDEVGRGTSTQDGLAIASAILEELSTKLGCLSMFATHYHELVPLAEKLKDCANVQVEIEAKNDKIVFTHRLIEGGSSQSFGIEVAELAGIPDHVIKRAKHYLESETLAATSVGATSSQLQAPQKLPITHKDDFEGEAMSRVRRRLLSSDPNKMTPLKALILLEELRGELVNKKDKDIFSEFTLSP